MYVWKSAIVNGRHTRLRFYKDTWRRLHDICVREKVTFDWFCSHIDRVREDIPLIHAVRGFAMTYLECKTNLYDYPTIELEPLKLEQKKIIGPATISEDEIE